MTALAGVVNSGRQLAEQFCRAALAAQSLYGDHRFDVRATEDAAFGMRLHSTLPEGREGAQPLSNERFLFVADVRLDDRRQLAEAVGVDPRGVSDLELLFAAWVRWGRAALDRIVGDFAFAVYDLQRRELTLARDPSGQRPLFFAQENQRIAFASMPSGVLADFPPAPDLGRIAQMLAGSGANDPRSCFHGVRRVLPGHAVILRDGNAQSVRYWDPSLEPFRNRSIDDLTDECRALLDQAVEVRLDRAGGRLATHLSSGFDSSGVTATAARLHPDHDPIIAFTAAPAFESGEEGPYGRPLDESPIAAEVAKRYGLEHVVVRDENSLLDVVRNYSRYYQEPVRNVLNMGWWTKINRIAQDMGASTLLTAEMGNMTLNAGELGILSEWIASGRWRQWWSEARAAMRHRGASWRGIAIASFAPWLPSPLILGLEQLYGARPSWTERFFSKELADAPQPTARGEAAQRRDRFTTVDYGPLRKGCLAQSGIDQRDPMADRRLAEFGLRLPPDQMLHDGTFSPLARRALSDRLPQSVLDLPLRGFQGGDWPMKLKKKDVSAAIEEISPSPAAQELLDFDRLEKTVEDWPTLNSSSVADLVFGRDLTAALAAGVFVAEVERNPASLGR